jgi:hypothetical protein
MVFGVSSCIVAWIVTSERSPLADYFLYHTAIPNIWAALHTVPYMIGLVIRPELLPEELVLYGLVSLQWMLVGYGISRVVYRGETESGAQVALTQSVDVLGNQKQRFTILKSVLLIGCGIVLSFVLLVLGTQVIVYVRGGLSASQIAEGQENGFALVADPIPTSSLVLFLVVVLCVGVFIGCLAKRVAPLAAAVSVGPLLWFLSAAGAWKLEVLYLSMAYLIFATGTAFVVARLRSKTSTTNSPV